VEQSLAFIAGAVKPEAKFVAVSSESADAIGVRRLVTITTPLDRAVEPEVDRCCD
jgi:hypothetical protein